jgi:23S rRNA (cytidine1920-2'-O)/16S rRNA (cytidine1409-2'-O)-methyltransferase
MAMKKIRLDILMTEKKLAESRSLAQRLIMAGQVRVDDQVILKPSTTVNPESAIRVVKSPPYVSRGGEKLAAALEAFPVQVDNQVCADVGASTGGFTDCLLQHGARTVYAIDVGEGILHWKLRQDRRVVVMEGTNARFLETLPGSVSIVSIDASFISLKILLPVVKKWMEEGGDVIALVKPQFEAGRSEVARGDGVVRDPEVHQRVLAEITTFAESTGYQVGGVIQSPLLGPKGNVEFLMWLRFQASETD